MRFLTYACLDPGRLRAAVDKVRAAIERDDLRSADVKKLQAAPYYRAKLDRASRLLLTFVRHRDETICLALEIIARRASCTRAAASSTCSTSRSRSTTPRRRCIGCRRRWCWSVRPARAKPH